MTGTQKDTAELPPTDSDTQTAASGSALRQALTEPTEQSWGEKHKVGALHFIRDIFVNYIFNFIMSAALAYKVIRSDLNTKTIEPFVERVATKGKMNFGIPYGVTDFVAKFFTRTQLLLSGGHFLLPFMKWTHNHKKEFEFKIGHALDSVQALFGSQAAKRSLREYDRVQQLRSGGTADLNDDDKALLAKHSIGENLQFKERPKTWWQFIKARLAGVSITTTMGILMGLSSSVPKDSKFSWIRFEEKFEDPTGTFLGKHFFKHIPFVGKRTQDLNLLGKFMVDEMLFTAGSKFGFDRFEKKQNEEQARLEAQAAAEPAPEKPSAAQRILRSERPVSYSAKREREREAAATPHMAGVS